MLDFGYYSIRQIQAKLMSTLSVPVPPNLDEFIKEQVKSGRAANKADVVRKALKLMREEEAIRVVLESEKEIGKGKILRGDLRKLMKKIK